MKNKMDFSIGVDIEDISRFSKLPYTSKKSFYDKIFTKKEIKYCLSKKNPYPHFTVRFCAKEATIKALENSNLSLKEIEIKMKNEKPYLSISNIGEAKVSMSHTSNYAIAMVFIFNQSGS